MPVASGKWSRLVSVYVTLMLISFSNVHAKDLSTSGLRKVEKTVYIILMHMSFSNVHVQAKDLFEYQWPQESGADCFFIIVTLMLLSFSNVQAKDLFEYQWPQESGADWFILLSL